MNAAERYLDARRLAVIARNELAAYRNRPGPLFDVLVRVGETRVEEAEAREAAALKALEADPADRWDIDPNPAFAIVRVA